MNWSQLQTLLWLRWRLSWNQLRKGRSLNLILAVIATVGGYALVITCAGGGFLLGWKLLGRAQANATLLTLDIFTGLFLFSWIIGLLNELQRSEIIDIQRLMHLPISLPQLFGINYLASHFTFSIIAAVPALTALSIGMAVSVGAQMLLLIPLALAFLLWVTSWTYCLRGWLVSLMVNQRRRRAITAGLTIAIILLAQGPNLYFNLTRPGGHRASRGAPFGSLETYGTSSESRLAHQLAPPLWLANGALALRQGNPWPAVGGTAGLSLLAFLGLAVAYRSTMRFYTGSSKVKPLVTTPPPPDKTPSTGPQPRKQLLVEWQLPLVRSDTAGLALASFRAMARAPEMKMMIVGPLTMMVLFYAIFFTRNRANMPIGLGEFAPTSLVLMLFFTMIQVLLNQFGLDRNGFRSLVLLPIPRKQMLLAKNLAFAPFVVPPALIALAVVPFVLKVSIGALAAGVLQTFTMYLLLSTMGNIYSIGVPFRIGAGSLKPTKNPPKVVLLMFVSHLLFPILSLPVIIPPAVEFLAHRAGWAEHVPLNLLLSGFSLVCTGLVYFGSLEGLGAWLQRREKDMLATLTQEIE
ncbi:MAG: hypothetical protein JNN07_18425 [Verrucomicrobiales bacterium]|nr:hypothetical protein [Verrucomicrobiales bacterium]